MPFKRNVSECLSLYGATLPQTYRYFSYYPNDHLGLKLTVSSILEFDIGVLTESLVSHRSELYGVPVSRYYIIPGELSETDMDSILATLHAILAIAFWSVAYVEFPANMWC